MLRAKSPHAKAQMNPSVTDVEPAPKTRFLTEFQIFVLFLTGALVIHFACAPFYFLYEDDYYHVGVPASQSLTWVAQQIKVVWQTLPQGRPALFTALLLQGGFINATGSVAAGYLPALLIVALNGYLTYRVFRHRLPQTAALTGALFCLLSCADPHKTLLTHTPLQFAITLNLLGLLLYQNQRPGLAYVVAGSSLLFYEISFAIFASAELFNSLHGRIRWKRLLASWGAWIGVAAAVFAYRLFRGEARAAEAAGNLGELGQRIATNVVWGPAYGLENSYFHALDLIFHRPQFWHLALSLLVVLGLGLMAITGSRNRGSELKPAPTISLFAGLGILLLLIFGPYALQLKRTVFAGFNRPVTGYHLCFGVALGFGVALLLAKCVAHPRWTKAVYVALALLACASTYENLLIQYDYVKCTRYQAFFWKEVQRTASDAEPGDVILIPYQNLLEASYILSNSWGLTHAWEVLFAQTGPLKAWNDIASVRPVKMFLVAPDWENHITLEADGYTLQHADYTPPGFRPGKIPLPSGHVIVLEADNAKPFTRRSEPIHVGNTRIELKKIPAEGPRVLPYTKIGKYLFERFIN